MSRWPEFSIYWNARATLEMPGNRGVPLLWYCYRPGFHPVRLPLPFFRH